MIAGVQETVENVHGGLGPSISEQSKVIDEWWMELANEWKPDIHHRFVRDVPISIVSKFLIKKGIVPDEYNALQLYIDDLGEDIVHKNVICRDDFMQIFSKRMFRDALLQVTKKIDLVGSEKYRESQSLVLRINEF